jgi:hypothetical protein
VPRPDPAPAAAPDAPEVPEVGRLAWMLFFEPVTLFHLLAEAGVATPGGSLLTLLTRGGPAGRVYAQRMTLIVALLAPLAALALAAAASLLVAPLPRGFVLLMLGTGLASGVAWALVLSAPFGAAMAVAIPLAGVGAITLLSTAGQPAQQPQWAALIIGGTPGAAAGLVFGVSRALAAGEPLSPWRGLGVALLLAAAGTFLFAHAGELQYRLLVGLALVVSFVGFCFRLVLWPLEALAQAVLYAVQRVFKVATLSWSPVLWHDLSYLPLPFLTAHVLDTARTDVETARRAVASCFIAPGQRGAGRVLQKRLKGVLFPGSLLP